MSTNKQTLVEYSTVLAKDKGTSKTSNLQSMFPGSPIHAGELTDVERLEFFQNLLDLDNIDSDPLHAAGGYYGLPNIDMNYIENGMPNMTDVQTGGGGLPASPYAPNPASPGPGSTSAADQPAYDGEVKNVDTINNFGTGQGGLVEPNVTSKNIANQKIGEYVSGRSYQGSDGLS
tara:strand:+ start:4273 stop:4797 length:525 start_codon:yes stop_codon:yes gene_type:complete